MPRAIWTGAISFALVNVPVRMYSAIDEQDLDFDYIHEKDGSRVGYQKYCKLEGEPIPDDEIVKGYEVEKGEYVYLTDEDFAAAHVENYKTIEIRDFVPYDAIDPIYFERTYYLGPQEGSERVYALLQRALSDCGLAAMAVYVMRDRQHLGCLRVRDGVIALEKMFFADEIRPTEGIAPGEVEVDAKELAMASELIDRFKGTFDPEQYEDTYRERLLEIVAAKRKGKEIHVEPPAPPEQPADLMAALRASLEAAQARRTPKRAPDDTDAKRDGRKRDRKPTRARR